MVRVYGLSLWMSCTDEDVVEQIAFYKETSCSSFPMVCNPSMIRSRWGERGCEGIAA